MKQLALRTPLLLLLSLLPTACGGGSSSGGGNPDAATAMADFLVATRGTDEVFRLGAAIEELRLVAEDGTRTPNLLAAELELELAGLDESACWLAHQELPKGTYTACEVVFDAASLDALAMDGSDVAVQVADGLWTVEFDEPWVAKGGKRATVELELDLVESLAGSADAPPLVFTPTGEVTLNASVRPIELDEVRGIVVEASLLDLSVTVDAFADAALTFSIGTVDVRIDDETVLIDDTGVAFDTVEGFFASLRLGLTLLEVQGQLEPEGVLHADYLKIEDQAGGIGKPPVVEIEGMVLYIDDEGFILLIRDIEEGADIAKPVLAGLGDPRAIDVDVDRNTEFKLPDGRTTSAESLRVGQIVDVEFDVFDKPPFLASEVELDSIGTQVSGLILDTQGLPDSFVLQVSDDHPLVDWGHVDYQRKIVVNVGEAEVVLDVKGEPALKPSQLVAGMKAKVEGLLVGPPDELHLDAKWIELRHGKLQKGVVSSVAGDLSGFRTSDGKVVKPFGFLVEDGPMGVLIAREAEFKKEATSAKEFLRLFESLDPGAYLDVKVKGIGTENPQEIIAYEVKTKVKKRNDDDVDDGKPDPSDDGDDKPDSDVLDDEKPEDESNDDDKPEVSAAG